MSDNIKTFTYGGWYLVLDKSEVFPNDPGQGTPAMVFSPGMKGSGTYNRVMGEGTVDGPNGDIGVPRSIYDWLEAKESVINTFLWPES